MVNVISELSKYGMLCCFLLFTLLGFCTLGRNKSGVFAVQRVFLFLVHFLGFLTLYVHTMEWKYILFYVVQTIFMIVMFLVYAVFYPKMSKLIINNMFMLLVIGFIMISRIAFARAVKQFLIVAVACVAALLVPMFIKKLKWITRPYWLYAAVGIVLLGIMKLAGIITYGASISFSIGGITIQPVEFVKIIFVFFLASYLSRRHDFKSVVIVSVVAAVHVLLLVWSRELGGALIFCMVYLALVYIATHQPLYFAGGMAGGSIAAFIAYHLFSHVRVRVQTWSTPFSVIRNDTSQISQGLFAIGTGGWFGLGLMQGIPQTIPVSSEDMIFAAITEELGLFFSLCLILICLSTFIMFINIATKIRDPFYKLLASGLGIEYIFQVFLTIGGGTKFIPLTGVTLPLVSYGGSSVLCSVLMFQLIQGIYVLRQSQQPQEEEYDELPQEDEPDYDEYETYDEDDFDEYADDYDEDDYEDDYEENYPDKRNLYRAKQQPGQNFDEYAVTDDYKLDIPDDFFED